MCTEEHSALNQRPGGQRRSPAGLPTQNLPWRRGLPRALTWGAPVLALHLPAVLLQLAVRERVEGVGACGAHDDVGLVLLLNDGLGGCHQLPLRTEGRLGLQEPCPDSSSSQARLQAGWGGAAFRAQRQP